MAASANKRTYYKRELPCPPAIPFSSAEGRTIFAEALAAGTAVGFFRLIEQFITQDEPQYCGLAAAAMTLNALGVDPRRPWKGAWRWFAETSLDCVKSAEDVKRDGVTLTEVACMLRCNGADVSLHRAGPPPAGFDQATFRRHLVDVCASEDRHLVVSYSRKRFGQSGDGHFSPVGAFHGGRGLVLVLDVARFKYGPHWVGVADLMEAMDMEDPATGRPRGFLLVSARTPRESSLLAVNPAALSAPRPAAPLTAPSNAQPALACPPGTMPPGAREQPVSAEAGQGQGQGQGQERGGRAEVPCGDGLQGCADAAAPWAPAVRFIREEGPRLIRQMLQLPLQQLQEAASQGEGQGQGQQEAAVDGAPNDDCGVEEEGGGDAAAEAAGRAGGVGTGGGVPGVVEVVCALVGAAPLAAVCQLLQRRLALVHVGEPTQGPCCACPGAEQQQHKQQAQDRAGAAGGGDVDCQPGRRQAPVDGAADCEGPGTPPPGRVGPPPCNSSSCCGPAARRRTLQSQAPADADGFHRAAIGAEHDGGGGLPGTPRGRTAPQDGPDAEGPDAGALPPSVSETGSDTGSLRRCPSVATMSSSGSSSAASSVVGSRSCSKESLETPACEGAADATTPAPAAAATQPASLLPPPPPPPCCHGEPLPHHCVPRPVQQLTLEELRFTHMFRVVRHALLRAVGCPHGGAARPPDLKLWTLPGGGASAAEASAEEEAAACGCLAAVEAAAGGDPLAAEKLTAALLLLPPEEEWWPADGDDVMVGVREEGAEQGAARVGPGVRWLTVAPGGGEGDGSKPVRLRVCGRARCRRCCRRAAAAGDAGCALWLLRDAWRSLLRLVPLGLFASAPILREELSYIRGQLQQVAAA